ncbi:MAG TPA: hypothetical protein VJV23_14985, partial [Candidatus Polarisedimenticolia bacterium]|nr:hypothetical protein [Candidatus Polarisedimenticolia bacterium]
APRGKEKTAGPAGRDRRRAEAEARNEQSRRLRAARERVAALERQVLEAEQLRDALDAQLADPSTYRTEGLARSLGERRKAVQESLSRLDREWDEAVSALERAGDASS